MATFFLFCCVAIAIVVAEEDGWAWKRRDEQESDVDRTRCVEFLGFLSFRWNARYRRIVVFEVDSNVFATVWCFLEMRCKHFIFGLIFVEMSWRGILTWQEKTKDPGKLKGRRMRLKYDFGSGYYNLLRATSIGFTTRFFIRNGEFDLIFKNLTSQHESF